MSLGVYGFGCEDSLNHLLNYVWPNVFETSPHVIQAVMGALEGLRVAIGPCRMLQYCLQVWLCVLGQQRAAVRQDFSAGDKKVNCRQFPTKEKLAFCLQSIILKGYSVPEYPDLNIGNRQ